MLSRCRYNATYNLSRCCNGFTYNYTNHTNRSKRFSSSASGSSATTSATTSAAMMIERIQDKLKKDKWALIKGEELLQILKELSPGAVDKEEVDRMVSLWSKCKPQVDECFRVVYPYKGTMVGYYCMADHEKQSFKRSMRLDWPPPNDRMPPSPPPSRKVIEHIDPTTAQYADETGVLASHFRIHKSWPAAADKNMTLVELQRFFFKVLPVVFPSPSNETETETETETNTNPISEYESMMTAFRVTKSYKEAGGIYHKGEPGRNEFHSFFYSHSHSHLHFHFLTLLISSIYLLPSYSLHLPFYTFLLTPTLTPNPNPSFSYYNLPHMEHKIFI